MPGPDTIAAAFNPARSAPRALSVPRAGAGEQGRIGEASAGTMGGYKITAARLQDADEVAYARLRPFRQVRKDHLDYYAGRWYGHEKPETKRSRPLNLVAQQIHAMVPHLVPRYVPRVKPLRAGLGSEARKLQLLVDNAQREQDFRETVLEPMVIDAMFSPWATCYTSLRPGERVLEIDGQGMDPGEPFTMFVEFDDVAVDPNAKDFRHALWFRHRYRVPRHWLLESPAYANVQDLILKLPAAEHEDGQTERSEEAAGKSTDAASRDQALWDTVELCNFAIYDRGRIYEATVTPKGRGPAEFLRFEEFIGPDEGPYDTLTYHRVLGNLPGLAPLSVTRDIAEVGDDLAHKVHEEAIRSKKIGAYKKGAEDDAAVVADAANGSMVGMDDPKNVQIHDLAMIQGDVAGILNMVSAQFQQAAGNPGLLGGTSEEASTLGQDEILDQRAGVRVSFLGGKVVGLSQRIFRKWCWYFQTDPVIDAHVAVPVPGVGPVNMTYSAVDRQGQPSDFTYEAQIVGQPATDPNMQARRTVEFIGVIMSNLQAFMPLGPGVPPLFKLRGVVESLAPMFGISDPEELVNDVELLLERIQAEEGADAWLLAANEQAPHLARPGVQDGAQQRSQQNMMALMQAGMMGVPGGGGIQSPGSRPVAGQDGLRRVGRPRA